MRISNVRISNVRNPIVRISNVRNPIVRNPIVQNPIVRNPIVRNPIVRISMLIAAVFVALGGAPSLGRASDPDTAGMRRLFDAQAAALAAKDEAAFRAGWHTEGYETNLVGGSGLSGHAVFQQGAREGWFLKPDLEALREAGRGGGWLVPCAVHSRAEDRAVDRVWVFPTWSGSAWVIVGAGEDRAEVTALAERWRERGAGSAPTRAPDPLPAPAAGSPAATLELVFAAARTGELAGLGALCRPGRGDGDVRRICALADPDADPKAVAEFRAWFAPGRVTGPAVEGEEGGERRASVPFVFGPDGTRAETMSLALQEGRWFLESF